MKFRYEIDGVIYVMTDFSNGVAHYKAINKQGVGMTSITDDIKISIGLITGMTLVMALFAILN